MHNRHTFSDVQSNQTRYEQQQRQQTLDKVIWIILVISIPLAYTNYLFGSILPAIIILLLSPVCLIAIILNKNRNYVFAGGLTVCLILIAIVYDIFDAGGLRSVMGAVAFPVFLAICGLFFGKRGIIVFSIITIIAIIVIGVTELNGVIIGDGSTDIYDIVSVIVLVTGMAIILWVIIDNNIQNLHQIQTNEKMLRLSNELTLESLAKALEYRDLETKNHSSRVVEMSVKLASAMGLRDEELEYIKHGALLHDIGKLAIPDSILQKPGKLTDEEWVIMKTHPAKAVEILEAIPLLKPSLEIPYCHHENWDGTGYPQGLKGEQIPLYARIFTIIDQWEALTNDRVYRKAWPYEKVIAYIKDNTGRIYDPHVTNTFLQMVKTDSICFHSSFIEGNIPVDII
jgi:putative nucleotidyltransferase with HDIG domain